MGSNQGSEGFALVRLDGDGPVIVGLRHALDFIEQNGFAHATQAGEQHAFLGLFLPHPPQEDASLLEDRVASDEFRRRRTGPGGEGVLDGVHIRFVVLYTDLYPKTSID